MEAVACQRILALKELDPAHFRHDDDGASHSAVRASAAADRIQAVAERHLETHRTAMALASPNVRVACHVACVSCSARRTIRRAVARRAKAEAVTRLLFAIKRRITSPAPIRPAG
jgi:hypothetical protein